MRTSWEHSDKILRRSWEHPQIIPRISWEHLDIIGEHMWTSENIGCLEPFYHSRTTLKFGGFWDWNVNSILHCVIWYHNIWKEYQKRGLRWSWIQVLAQRHLALGEGPRNVLFWRPQIVPLRLKGRLLLTFVVSGRRDIWTMGLGSPDPQTIASTENLCFEVLLQTNPSTDCWLS